MKGRLRVRRYWLPELGDRVMISTPYYQTPDDVARTWMMREYGSAGVACNPANAVDLIERARAEGFTIEEDWWCSTCNKQFTLPEVGPALTEGDCWVCHECAGEG